MSLTQLLQTPGVFPTNPGEDRVLVVDDDLAQRTAMVRTLRRHGYECAGAMSTQEARDQLRSSDFGLVITDLRMYAEDGLALVRYVADRYPDTYSIVITGFASDEDFDSVQRAGAFGLLIKPVPPDSFITTVEGAFKHRRVGIAHQRHQTA